MAVSDELIEKWEPIINSVSKSNVPSDCIHRLVIKLNGGSPTQKTINIKKLKKQGYSDDDIDSIIDCTLQDLNADIKHVDMFVNIEAVAEMVQPVTNKLLNL